MRSFCYGPINRRFLWACTASCTGLVLESMNELAILQLCEWCVTWRNYQRCNAKQHRCGQIFRPPFCFYHNNHNKTQNTQILHHFGRFQHIKYDILTICWLLEVDVCITKRSSCDHISAYSDWYNWSSCGEFLEQHSFCNIGMEIPNIQGCHGITWSGWIHLGLLVWSYKTCTKFSARFKMATTRCFLQSSIRPVFKSIFSFEKQLSVSLILGCL